MQNPRTGFEQPRPHRGDREEVGLARSRSRQDFADAGHGGERIPVPLADAQLPGVAHRVPYKQAAGRIAQQSDAAAAMGKLAKPVRAADAVPALRLVSAAH